MTQTHFEHTGSAGDGLYDGKKEVTSTAPGMSLLDAGLQEIRSLAKSVTSDVAASLGFPSINSGDSGRVLTGAAGGQGDASAAKGDSGRVLTGAAGGPEVASIIKGDSVPPPTGAAGGDGKPVPSEGRKPPTPPSDGQPAGQGRPKPDSHQSFLPVPEPPPVISPEQLIKTPAQQSAEKAPPTVSPETPPAQRPPDLPMKTKAQIDAEKAPPTADRPLPPAQADPDGWRPYWPEWTPPPRKPTPIESTR